MTRQSCDRCGTDVTNKKSACVSVVGDSDVQCNGKETSRWDLCPRCYGSLKTWIAHSFEKRKR